MRRILITIIIFQISFIGKSQVYDTSLVKLRTEIINGNTRVEIIYLSKKNQKIKTKFIAYELNNQSVYERFKNFSEQNILIFYSTAVYSDVLIDNYGKRIPQLVGLAIDQGKLINGKIEKGRMDGLVVIYPNGVVKVFNIKDKIIEVNERGMHLSFGISSYSDLARFKSWAMRNQTTVFQTHLLVWNNELKFEKNYYIKNNKRERRFLAIGTDENGNEIHCLVNYNKNQTLFDSSKNILQFLQNDKSIKVTAMINMETGASDVAGFLWSNGVKSSIFSGKMDPSQSNNFLIYYFNK